MRENLRAGFEINRRFKNVYTRPEKVERIVIYRKRRILKNGGITHVGRKNTVRYIALSPPRPPPAESSSFIVEVEPKIFSRKSRYVTLEIQVEMSEIVSRGH